MADLKDRVGPATGANANLIKESADLITGDGDQCVYLRGAGVPDGSVLTRDSSAPEGLSWQPGISDTPFYQEVESPPGTSFTQRDALAFSSDFVVTDNAIDNRTEVALAVDPGEAAALVLIDNKTLGAPTTEIEFTGLNGDTDGDYIIVGSMTNAASANAKVDIQFNGSGVGIVMNGWSINALNGNINDATSAGYDMMLFIAGTCVNNFFLEIYSKTGRRRTGWSKLQDSDDGTTPKRDYTTRFIWDDTATNITAIKLISRTGGNVFSTGDNFQLYKRLRVPA